MYIKINKANLADSISTAESLRFKLSLAKTALTTFKSNAESHCSNWVNSYWYRFIDKTGVKRSSYEYKATDSNGVEYTACHETAYEDAVEAAARAIVQKKVEAYKNYTNDISKVVQEKYLLMIDIFSALSKVQGLLDAYESTPVGSLEEYFKASFDKHDNVNYEDFNYKFEYEEDDEGIISQELYVQINEEYEKLDEANVAFVTNTSAKVAGSVLIVDQLVNDKDFQSKSPEEQRRIATQAIAANNEIADKQTESYKKRNLFSTTSMDEIAARYEEDTGNKYDAERASQEAKVLRERAGYGDDEERKKMLGASAAAVTSAGVFNFANIHGAASDQELEDEGLGNLAEGRKNVKEGKIYDDDGNVDEEKLIDPESKKAPEELVGEEGGDLPGTSEQGPKREVRVEEFGGGDGSDDGEAGIAPDNTTPEDPAQPADPDIKDPEEAVIPDKRLDITVEDPIPDPPDSNTKMDNATADRLAEEQFYEKYTPEQLADYRNEQKLEFEDLFAKEDKSELIDFYEDAGYDLESAKVIAENKELGLAAFLAAKQSADLADMSRNIAQGANMDMTMFDTRFDDGASYKDLLSGDTNAFLTNPNQDSGVADAKQTMNGAKAQYDRAVDNANKSIEEANTNKDKLDNVRKQIVKKSGNDSSKWSDEDVEEYNKAVNDYNESVKKANDDVSSAQDAKSEYEASREAYETSKDEYYDKVKEDILNNRESVGDPDVEVNEAPEPGPNDNATGDAGNQTEPSGGSDKPEPTPDQSGDNDPTTDDSGWGFGKDEPSDSTPSPSQGNEGMGPDTIGDGANVETEMPQGPEYPNTPPDQVEPSGETSTPTIDDSGSGWGFGNNDIPNVGETVPEPPTTNISNNIGPEIINTTDVDVQNTIPENIPENYVGVSYVNDHSSEYIYSDDEESNGSQPRINNGSGFGF